MDAVKFLEEAKRMCDSDPKCEFCPFSYRDEYHDLRCANPVDTDRYSMSEDEFTDIVNTVENWAKTHPKKTNREKFLEIFGKLDEHRFMTDKYAWQKWLEEEYKGG